MSSVATIHVIQPPPPLTRRFTALLNGVELAAGSSKGRRLPFASLYQIDFLDYGFSASTQTCMFPKSPFFNFSLIRVEQSLLTQIPLFYDFTYNNGASIPRRTELEYLCNFRTSDKTFLCQIITTCLVDSCVIRQLKFVL
jgi:hypothetical protein